jgi:hypothetical protein
MLHTFTQALTHDSYDLILEVTEEFLNRTLEKGYENRAIPRTFQGTYDANLPKILRDYGKIEYNITLT